MLYLRHFEVRGCFEKMTRKLNKGVTLVEVMAALVIALVIAIGVMSYQYACMQHARKTDIRVTGSRIGLLFLERWVADGGIYDDEDYDLLERLGLSDDEPPFPEGNLINDIDVDLPGLPNSFKSYGIFTNGTWFWVKLTYIEEGMPPMVIRELGVSIAWSLDFAADELVYDPQRLVRFSKSVRYNYPTPST